MSYSLAVEAPELAPETILVRPFLGPDDLCTVSHQVDGRNRLKFWSPAVVAQRTELALDLQLLIQADYVTQASSLYGLPLRSAAWNPECRVLELVPTWDQLSSGLAVRSWLRLFGDDVPATFRLAWAEL